MNFMKTIEMKCVMGELDHPNHNGRIYDSNMMKEAIEKWKENGCKFAELKPDYKNIDFMNPCLSEAVAKVEDVWIEDNKVLGKVELLDTPKGKTLQELINGGREFQINPRISGDIEWTYEQNGNPSYDKDGNHICEIKNVQVISFDIV